MNKFNYNDFVDELTNYYFDFEIGGGELDKIQIIHRVSDDYEKAFNDVLTFLDIFVEYAEEFKDDSESGKRNWENYCDSLFVMPAFIGFDWEHIDEDENYCERVCYALRELTKDVTDSVGRVPVSID